MKKRIQQLLQLLTVIPCLLFVNTAFANTFTVNNQADWDLITLPLLPGNTIIITDLATGSDAIVSMTGMASIQGTIINSGDFTMNSSGVSIVMSGKILNLGTFTVGNVGLSVEGTFENAGTLNVDGAGVVIQNSGELLNTGVINNNINITINGSGSVLTCNTITGSGSVTGSAIGGNPPIGTACDDGDDATINDQITDEACTCAGEVIISAAPLPALGKWGVLLLGSILLVMSTFLLRQRL